MIIHIYVQLYNQYNIRYGNNGNSFFIKLYLMFQIRLKYGFIVCCRTHGNLTLFSMTCLPDIIILD